MDTTDEADYVDGNAVAGVFAEAFGLDVAVVVVACRNCGLERRFAENHVYHRGPGAVARCPECGHVTARVVRTPTDVWLDLQGSRSWRIPMTPAVTEAGSA
jgi:hypothetical protein